MKKRLVNVLYVLVALQVLIWACWSFVLMDAITPLTDTFDSSNGRGAYLAFVVIVLALFCPYLFPID